MLKEVAMAKFPGTVHNLLNISDTHTVCDFIPVVGVAIY